MIKKDFQEVDIQTMLAMRDKGWSLKQIAKNYHTNKPSILKSLKLWDSGEQVMPDGRHYVITRGKPIILPQKDDVKEEMEKTKQVMKKLQEKND